MKDREDLAERLRQIDGRGYKAYRDIESSFDLEHATLFVDRVQSDPYASPSKLRIRVPMERAALPPDLHSNPTRKLALETHLARCFRSLARNPAAAAPSARQAGSADAREAGRRRGGSAAGSGKSGEIWIDAGGQQVLERTAVQVTSDWVEARIEVGLPAAGRRVLGRAAHTLLLERLPEIASRTLCWNELDPGEGRRFVESIENQEGIRHQLDALGLLAFVGNGARLPRESGASDRPLDASSVVPFESPSSFEVEVELANPIDSAEGPRSCLRGMGIPRGVTLIVGGGYHGKSTLLDALERAVYPHVPGDGRDCVVTARDVVKVCAEDGRSVAGVDIRPFIGVLPGGPDPSAFSTRDASGSTSQAASILEALESGATGLLLDEDTSATNFMVRDARMQALVAKEDEPITPFIDRVRELYDRFGVSTVLVMGGSGDYFDVSDRVIGMREYVAGDRTRDAKTVAREMPIDRRIESRDPMPTTSARRPDAASIDATDRRGKTRINAKGTHQLLFGSELVELRAVAQLCDPSQTRAIGFALEHLRQGFLDATPSLAEALDDLDVLLDERGLVALDARIPPGRHPGNFARPRRHEVAAALNRLRSLRMLR